MADLRTKTMCQTAFLYFMQKQSLEAVSEELGLPAAEVTAMLIEYRTRVLANPKYQASAKSKRKTSRKQRQGRKNTG